MHILDILIVGAGPGGVQLALTLGEIRQRTSAHFTYRVIEKTSGPGSFFSTFPVHGRLISNNKLYTGRDPKSRFSERFDWNSLVTQDRSILLRDYSRDFYPVRDVIPTMLMDLCHRYSVPVDFNVSVRQISPTDNGLFDVDTSEGSIRARYVVVATGLKPFVARIPGIELPTPYASMKPRQHYRDKRTLIIGKGNSGFECANEIINEANVVMIASPSPTRLAYRTHYVGSVRQTNALPIENYQLKNQSAILDCDITQIARSSAGYEVTVAYKHADGEAETLVFDEVIAATGFTGNLDVLQGGLNIHLLHNKFPEIDGTFQSCQIGGLYFAGALTHGIDYRGYSSSGFIHGFRYNSMILATHLCEKLGITEPQTAIRQSAIVDHLFNELEEDAGIYLQPGYIGRCYRRTGIGDWIDLGHRTKLWFENEQAGDDILLLATLEYADINRFPDPLLIPRHPGNASESVHIHPVIRARSGGDTRHVCLEENLLNRFGHMSNNQHLLKSFMEDIDAASRAMLSCR